MRQYFRRRCLHASSICRTISELLPNSLFLRAVHRNYDSPSQRIQRIYQIQKTKITQGDCLHPSYRFYIRFQVAFRTREKIEGLGSQTILSFSGFESVGIKRHCQGSAVSKIERTIPKWATGLCLRLAFSIN